MGIKKSILIRTDGNPDIATGHLMRCLSVAQALHDKEVSVFFAVADEVSAGLLRSFFQSGEEFPIYPLHTDYRCPESESAPLSSLLSEIAIGGILVDSYFITPAYLEMLKCRTRTAYIDDLYSFDYPVDLLINYDAVVSPAFYHKAEWTLFGPAYTPLRKQFAGIRPIVSPRIREVLISTGGTDPCHLAESLVNLLLESPVSRDWRCHVLAGPMHSGRKALEKLTPSHPGLILHGHVEQMAALMQRCDLAVSAAGTTLCELCAAGVPTVSFTMADNQLVTARQFEDCAAVPYAGDVRTADNLPSVLCRTLYRLASDYEGRKSLSSSMHRLIDGNGAGRIADALIRLLDS